MKNFINRLWNDRQGDIVIEGTSFTAIMVFAISAAIALLFLFGINLVKFAERIQNEKTYNEYCYSVYGKNSHWNKQDVPAGQRPVCTLNQLGTNTYIIKWIDYDGTILEIDTHVKENAIPKYNGGIPERVGDSSRTFVFIGWDKDVKPATKDETYIAMYNSSYSTYTITWKNWDDSPLNKEIVPFGSVPVYKTTTPTKVEDTRYSFVFKGWTPELTKVDSNKEYTAVFDKVEKTFNIIWKNWDGSTLEIDSKVKYGSTPKYNGKEPTKSSTSQYTFTFAGWDSELNPITNDMVFTAQFNYVVNKFKILWKNYDGTLLKEEKLAFGDMPSNLDIPTRTDDNQYSYLFTNWSPTVAPVTEDTEYKAEFSTKDKYYIVRYTNWDNTVLYTQSNVKYGTTSAYSGPTPIKPAKGEIKYTFTNWYNESSGKINDFIVNSDITLKAQFSATANSYNITWKNWDGTVLKIENIDIGGYPTFNGEIPTRPDDYEYRYTFKGWTPEITNVSGDSTFTAEYTRRLLFDYEKENMCTVSGVDSLAQGTIYSDGIYKYSYKQKAKFVNEGWNTVKKFENMNEDGWGIMLIDSTSTEVINQKPCTYINDKPVINYDYLFAKSSAQKIDTKLFNTKNVNSMKGTFMETSATTIDITNINSFSVINMENLFADKSYWISEAPNLEIIGLEKLNTSNVEDMKYMFYFNRCRNLNTSNINTAKTKTMAGMFANSYATEINISSFDTSNVSDFSFMFGRINGPASKGASVTNIIGLNEIDTRKATTMAGMFSSTKLDIIDLSNFNVENVVSMETMFNKSVAKKIIINTFNTPKLEEMVLMFSETQVDVIDLSSFNLSRVNGLDDQYMLPGTFYQSKANFGLAKNKEDAIKLNNSYNNPTTLKFYVKDSDINFTVNGKTYNAKAGEKFSKYFNCTELFCSIPGSGQQFNGYIMDSKNNQVNGTTLMTPSGIYHGTVGGGN